MRTLAHSARRIRAEGGGEYLPSPFRPLEERGIKARLGTATFIVGPPGAFKSGFTMAYLVKLALPTMYCSADMEDFETVERAAAIVTGRPMSEVSRNYEQFEEALRDLSHMRFCYDSSPTYGDLILEIMAFAEVEGQFPKVIVIDTLMKVVGESEDEWASMRDTAQVIHEIARKTGAAVFVLHHASDDRQDTTTPAPRNKMQGKVSQLPKAIWSLALAGDELRIAAVKSKWCREDPSGRDYATLFVDGSTNRVFNSRYELGQAS